MANIAPKIGPMRSLPSPKPPFLGVVLPPLLPWVVIQPGDPLFHAGEPPLLLVDGMPGPPVPVFIMVEAPPLGAVEGPMGPVAGLKPLGTVDPPPFGMVLPLPPDPKVDPIGPVADAVEIPTQVPAVKVKPGSHDSHVVAEAVQTGQLGGHLAQ